MTRSRLPRRWLIAYLLVRAVVVTVIGILLLMRPGDTVRNLARVIGWVLLALGTVDIVAAATGGAPRRVRGLVLVRGAVTVALGAIVAFLTDATITVVAILAGMQLVVGGGVSILLGTIARDDGHPLVWGVIVRGVVTAVVGAALIAWPEKSVSAVAVVLGIQWIVSGFVSTVVAVALGTRPVRA